MEASFINISECVAIYQESGKHSESSTFCIEYRKENGDYGFKDGCKRVAGTGHLKRNENSVKPNVERDADKFHLLDKDGHRFEVFIGLLVKFDGKIINHKY